MTKNKYRILSFKCIFQGKLQLTLVKITTYPLVIWPKFKLPTYGLKFDILTT